MDNNKTRNESIHRLHVEDGYKPASRNSRLLEHQSRSPLCSNRHRDRFEKISRYLHFVDNTTLPARDNPSFDRLQKIAPIVDQVNSALSAVYYPHCQVSINKAMIAFKGRSSMKQYVPLKPIKRGFKIWVLADARNGYFCKIKPYIHWCIRRLTLHWAGRKGCHGFVQCILWTGSSCLL